MARGFDINFDIIDNAFVNILTRGFAIDFPLPSIQTRDIAINTFNFTFAANWIEGSPSMVSMTSTMPTTLISHKKSERISHKSKPRGVGEECIGQAMQSA